MSELIKLLKDSPFEEVKKILEVKPYCCKIKEDDYFKKYYMINYDQIKSDFYNAVVRECRGIILTKDTNEIVCRPFDKFGNYGEGYVPDLDWDSTRVLEKIDGSLIKVWYSEEYNQWVVSSNGTINACNAEIQIDISPFKSYGDLFRYCFTECRYLRPDCTTMFEVVSPWSRIVVQYPEADVYHLGTRHNRTGQYFEEPIEGCKRPKEFKLSTIEDVVQAAKDLPFNHEGYVVVDKHYNRIKVKSPAYVAVHHLKANGVIDRKRLLRLILLNEVQEFISYFPEYAKEVLKIEEIFLDFMDVIYKDVDDFLNHSIIDKTNRVERKEFATWAVQTAFPTLMFSLLDEKIEIENWREFVREMEPEKLLKFIDNYAKK